MTEIEYLIFGYGKEIQMKISIAFIVGQLKENFRFILQKTQKCKNMNLNF